MPRGKRTGEKPKAIYLGQHREISDKVWLEICKTKRLILENNPARSAVSNEEAIFYLIENKCK